MPSGSTTSRCLTGVGDVLMAEGNLAEALKSYQEGLAVADRLAESDLPAGSAMSPFHTERSAMC